MGKLWERSDMLTNQLSNVQSEEEFYKVMEKMAENQKALYQLNTESAKQYNKLAEAQQKRTGLGDKYYIDDLKSTRDAMIQ